MLKDKSPVVFLDADGNEISNDPLWHAQKVMRDRGIPFGASQPTEAEVQTDELSGGNGQSGNPATPPQGQVNEQTQSDDDDELEQDDDTPTYADVKGKDLTELAKSRGVELTPGIKAGEVRAALIEQDKAAAAKADDTQE